MLATIEMRAAQLEPGDQRRIDGEADFDAAAERLGDAPLRRRLLVGRQRRSADDLQGSARSGVAALLVRQGANGGDETVEKGGAHRGRVEPAGEPPGDLERETRRPFGEGALGGLTLGRHRRARRRLDFARPAIRFGAPRRALLLGGRPRRGEDRLALGGETGARLDRLGDRRLGLAALGFGLGEDAARRLAPLFDHGGKRPPEEPRENPDQDRDVDGLEAERPPVDGHAIISAADWRTAAAAQ